MEIFVGQFVCPSVLFPFCQFVCPSVLYPFCQFVCPSVLFPFCQFVCPSVLFPFCQFVCPSVLFPFCFVLGFLFRIRYFLSCDCECAKVHLNDLMQWNLKLSRGSSWTSCHSEVWCCAVSRKPFVTVLLYWWWWLQSVSQHMCCYTEIEVADQTCHPTQPPYTDTKPASPHIDPGRVVIWEPVLKSLVWPHWGQWGLIPRSPTLEEMRLTMTGHPSWLGLSTFCPTRLTFSKLTGLCSHHQVITQSPVIFLFIISSRAYVLCYQCNFFVYWFWKPYFVSLMQKSSYFFTHDKSVWWITSIQLNCQHRMAVSVWPWAAVCLIMVSNSDWVNFLQIWFSVFISRSSYQRGKTRTICL